MDQINTNINETQRSKQIHNSFLHTSLLFAINHGALLSCLGLANARLGNTVASTSSSVLYGCYTGFALLGAPYVVKVCGAQRALILGMGLTALYVASFWGVVEFCYSSDAKKIDDKSVDTYNGTLDASLDEDETILFDEQNSVCSNTIATMGGIVGGLGSAILWTSQGSFFSDTSHQYARAIQGDVSFEKVTSRLGGEWAFVFLFIEVWMRMLSTMLVNGWRPWRGDDKVHVDDISSNRDDRNGMDWKCVFITYTVFAAGAVICMRWVNFYNEDLEGPEKEDVCDGISLRVKNNDMEEIDRIASAQKEEYEQDVATETISLKQEFEHLTSYDDDNANTEITQCLDTEVKSPFRKAIAAIDLLIYDPKMKYLSFVNITFGLCTAFTSSVVNGQVIRIALNDENSNYVGVFTAVTSFVAAVLSWVFGTLEWLTPSSTSELSSPVPTAESSLVSSFIRLFQCKALSKSFVLSMGAISYLIIALLFLLVPSFSSWSVPSLLLIYILLGIGRSTYEGTLRAVYADL